MMDASSGVPVSSSHHKEGRKFSKSFTQGHPGIARMKALACSFVWWPGIDKELEMKVKQCEPCQKNQHLPATAPI